MSASPTVDTREYRLTFHARKRCREMGVAEGEVARVLMSPDASYPAPAKYRIPGTDRRVAYAGRFAVVYDAKSCTVITVLWNTAPFDGAEFVRGDASPYAEAPEPEPEPEPEPVRRERKRSYIGASFESDDPTPGELRAMKLVAASYLRLLDAPRVNRGAIDETIRTLRALIANEPDPLQRLKLVQRRLDAEERRETGVTDAEVAEVERRFVEVAAPLSRALDVSRKRWRERGVSKRVLDAAGVRR